MQLYRDGELAQGLQRLVQPDLEKSRYLRAKPSLGLLALLLGPARFCRAACRFDSLFEGELLGGGFSSSAPKLHCGSIFPWHDYRFTTRQSFRMRSGA
jgi:hypothetical protein